MNAGNIELYALAFEEVGAFHCSAVEVRERDSGRILHSWPIRVCDNTALTWRFQHAAERAVQMYMGTTRALLPRRLPTIAEMSGIIHDFTNGKSMKEYMEELADE